MFARCSFTASALAAAFLCASTHVQAQSMKPGLWEITHRAGGNPKMEEAMQRMDQQMAAMTPEQRKMMQDMMARNGVAMGAAAPGGGGTTVKVCISKEMAEQRHMPVQQQGECTRTVTSQSASSMKLQFACKNPSSSGEGTFTFGGDSAYQMVMKVTSQVQGKLETMDLNASGKWLGADCGALKPVAGGSR